MAKKCPKCQSDNPDTLKFCGECGTQLPSLEEIEVTETIEAPKEELARGTTVAGRYEIIEELGKGGMGRVYRVEDTKLKQEVALKLIKPEIAKDKKTIERFRNELKLARNIRHKNVCGMFDLGETEGAHFITMEYIRGEDLKSFIHRSGQLAVGTSVRIAKQICEGLSEAHKLGVVHRDLKSNNIMIDKEGNVRIMDFGIARSLGAKGITGAGVIIGTPEYMSPEQVEGKEVDQRSDIYSLGIILYEMVSGRVPFEGDTPFVIGMKHKSEEPKEPKDFNTLISEDLNLAILRCLEKEKANRYQSPTEFLSVLNQIEQSIPTTECSVSKSKPITSKEITVRFTPKKLLVPAAIVLLFLVIAFLVFKNPGPELNPRRVVVSVFENQTGDESLDNIGSTAANWISQGLQQSGIVEVVPATVLLETSPITGEELEGIQSMSFFHQLARKTGAGVVVSGVYILDDDSLSFQAKIIDAKSEKILYSLPSVSHALEEKMEAIEKLRDAVTGSLASHFDVPFGGYPGSKPPLFEAYEEYMLALDLFMTNRAQCIKHLERAIELDSEFYFPYIVMAMAQGRDYEKAASYHKILNQKRNQLSPYERCWLDWNMAKNRGNYLEALQAMKQAEELEPTSITVKALIGQYSNLVNYPGNTVKMLSNLKLESYEKFMNIGWGRALFNYLLAAHHMLENYKQVLKEVRRARKYYPEQFYQQEVRALAALGRTTGIKEVIDRSLASTSGLEDPGDIMYVAAIELRRHGYLAAYKEIADRLVEWLKKSFDKDPENDSLRYSFGQALYLAADWENAFSVFTELEEKHPNNINYKGYLGTLAVRMGNTVKAEQLSEWLKNLNRPYIFGRHTYYRAKIASLLGDRKQALSFLREALTQGQAYGVALLSDMDFEPLRNYKPFQDLLKPKG